MLMKKVLFLVLACCLFIATQAQSFSISYNGQTYNHKDTMDFPIKIGNPYVVQGLSFHNNTENNMQVIASCNEVEPNGIVVAGASNGNSSTTNYYTAPFTIAAGGDYSGCSFDLNVPSSLNVGESAMFYFLVSSAASGVPDSSAGTYVFVRFTVVPDAGYVYFSENFDNTSLISGYFYRLPTGWTSIADNNANYSDYTSWGKGWTVVNVENGNKMAASVSYLNSTTAHADRWLITPHLIIPYSGLHLTFIAYGQDDSYPESIKVKVSTASAGKADFTEELLNVSRVPAGPNHYMLDLSQFAGDSIYIAFINCGTNGYYVFLDEVQILMPNTNEIELSDIQLPNIAPAQTPITIKGSITNWGLNNLEYYDVYYVANGTDTSQIYTVGGINIPYGSSHSFVHNVPYTSILGTNNIQVFVSMPNGVADDPANNTLSGSFSAYDPAGTTPRKILMENFTTAQCPNCPSAHTRIHNAIANRNDVIWLAHHVGYGTDAMTLSASNQLTRFYNDGGSTYAPALMLDRTHFTGAAFDDAPGPVFFPDNDVADAIQTASEMPAFVSVYFPQITYSQDTRELNITVAGEFKSDMTMSSPRLSVYLMEDSIMKAQSGVSGLFRHDHVIRAAITNILGDASVITSTTAGSTFEASYTYTLPSSFKDNYCRVIAFVSNYNSANVNDCQVANSNVSEFLHNGNVLGIGDIESNVSIRTYPNPATDFLHIDADKNIQEITLVNALGQTVYRQNDINNGSATINTQRLSAGLYIVTIKSSDGIASRHINIVK